MVLPGTDRLSASAAMRKAGSLYWLGTRDATGAFLDWGKTYKLTVPMPVPERLFWSVTIYDPLNRSEIQTDQGKAALRSLFESKGKTGSSVDLYSARPRRPAPKANGSRRSPAKGGSSTSASTAPRRPSSTEAGSRGISSW